MAAPKNNGILYVEGQQVIDPHTDQPIILRGTALGGCLNMENFITGYPGQENQHRASMLNVLGQENYDFFFDKFYENFWSDKDAAFFKSKGMNCLRIPFNYHHFEDDMNPRVLKDGCWKWLDRIIDICTAHSIYTILDLHAVPGAQNPDWHSDNNTNHAAFWDHKDFQDRVIWLWSQIATRYKSHRYMAGYNPLNEPCDPLHHRLPAFYARLETALRGIDPNHILWLDGNTFAMEWRGFEQTLPNCVYALHDYSLMGFPLGEPFKGRAEQKAKLEAQFLRKASFMDEHATPIWNGEFGPVYADPALDGKEEAEATNAKRYALLEAQLGLYDKYGIHWSIWLWKDIGLQGMTYVSQESRWMKTIAGFLEKKRRLQIDAWGRRPSDEVDRVIKPLVEWIDKNAPKSKDMYPTPWATERQISRLINQLWVAGALSDEFAELFRGMSKEDLEECAKSFHFDNCVQREGLNQALIAHAEVPSISRDWKRPHPKDANQSKETKLELD